MLGFIIDVLDLISPTRGSSKTEKLYEDEEGNLTKQAIIIAIFIIVVVVALIVIWAINLSSKS